MRRGVLANVFLFCSTLTQSSRRHQTDKGLHGLKNFRSAGPSVAMHDNFFTCVNAVYATSGMAKFSRNKVTCGTLVPIGFAMVIV